MGVAPAVCGFQVFHGADSIVIADGFPVAALQGVVGVVDHDSGFLGVSNGVRVDGGQAYMTQAQEHVQVMMAGNTHCSVVSGCQIGHLEPLEKLTQIAG